MFRAAVIGCGGSGTLHARAYANLPLSQLVGVCDLDQARARAVAGELGVPAFTDLHEMLARVKPDIVSVCTKEDQHEGPVLAALAAGTHVFCEKIMAGTLANGRMMVAAAKEANRVLAVNYNYRHLPGYQWLKAQLNQGAIGTPTLAVISAHSYCWHHALDLCRFFFGEVVEATASLADNPNQMPHPWRNQKELLYVPSLGVGATLTFESGMRAVLASSIYYDMRAFLIDIHVFGTGGQIGVRRMRLDDARGTLEHAVRGVAQSVPELPFVAFSDSFRLSIDAFLNAMSQNKPVPTTGEDGYAAMLLESAVVRSSASGSAINLPELALQQAG